MNTQTQEALKMAIEMLEKLSYEYGRLLDGDQDYGLLPSEINADIIKTYYVKRTCQEALEQPAQDSEQAPFKQPVAWNEEEFNDIAYAYRTCPAHEIKMVSDRYQELVNYVLSITHPAPSWKGLSDDEVTDLANFWDISDIGIEAFIDKVVRKSKEKNT